MLLRKETLALPCSVLRCKCFSGNIFHSVYPQKKSTNPHRRDPFPQDSEASPTLSLRDNYMMYPFPGKCLKKDGQKLYVPTGAFGTSKWCTMSLFLLQ